MLVSRVVVGIACLQQTVVTSVFPETPVVGMSNPIGAPHRTLINNVDFHPHDDTMFLATFTQAHTVGIFKIHDHGRELSLVREVTAMFPQWAIFLPDGSGFLVAPFYEAYFVFHSSRGSTIKVPYPSELISDSNENFGPHTLDLNRNGSLLAVTFGSSLDNPRRLALFHTDFHQKPPIVRLASLLRDPFIDAGIPKGITFTKDESKLVVCFANSGALAIYDLLQSVVGNNNQTLAPLPMTVYDSGDFMLGRPEDVKFSNDGDFLAITNSQGRQDIVVYEYDQISHQLKNSSGGPAYVLQGFQVPHSVAFSPSGNFLAVVQFGPTVFNKLLGTILSLGDDSTVSRNESIILYRLGKT